MLFLELLIGFFKTLKFCLKSFFPRLHLMSWSQRRGAWDEGGVLNIRNLYTIKSLAWKYDGSILACSNMLGAVIAIDCSMKVKKFFSYFMFISLPLF